nr:phospholipase-like protein [Tanacetum cinerariifolium]
MIDLDPGDDLVQDYLIHEKSRLKQEGEERKRTQRSSTFLAYYWGNMFDMAEKDRPLNSLNDQDMNIFLKDVTPCVEDLSCYNRATDIVHLSDAFDIFLGRQGPLHCRFPWCKDVSVDRRFWKSLVCLDPTKKGWIMDELLLQDSIPSWYADGTMYKVSWCDVEEDKIPKVMMQAKAFDQKGIDHTRYTISFTNTINVPKQGGVFGDCDCWCLTVWHSFIQIGLTWLTNKLSSGVLDHAKCPQICCKTSLREFLPHADNLVDISMASIKHGCDEYMEQPVLPASMAYVLCFNVVLAPLPRWSNDSVPDTSWFKPISYWRLYKYWDEMGQDVLRLLEDWIDNRAWYRGSTVAVSAGAAGFILQASLLTMAVAVYWSGALLKQTSLLFFFGFIAAAKKRSRRHLTETNKYINGNG